MRLAKVLPSLLSLVKSDKAWMQSMRKLVREEDAANIDLDAYVEIADNSGIGQTAERQLREINVPIPAER